MRPSLPALTAMVVIAGVLGAPGAAAADDPLAPGQTRTMVIPVPGTWAAEAAEVTLTVRDLQQSENGCLEPEAEAGDDCSSDAGELAGKLRTTVAWGQAVGSACVPGAQAEPLDLLGAASTRLTPVRGVECLLLATSFPDGDLDDVAQSDTLTFGLDIVGRGLAAEDAAALPVGNAEVPAGDRDEVSGGQSGYAPAGPADEPVSLSGPAGQNGAPLGGSGQAVAAGAGTAAPATDAGLPQGPVLDRVDAQVSVGGDGVGVQTQAAGTSLQALVVMWSAALLGMVGLGWMLFLLVRRRRRRAEATA